MSPATPSKIVLSRSSGRSSARVCHHPCSMARRRPSLSWTIPYPHAAVPGSIPRTLTAKGYGGCRTVLHRVLESRPMAGDIWLTLPDGTEYELTGPLMIGRGDENDLVIPSSAVSRKHAAVVEREKRWYVEDRGSYNGTFLNGVRVNPGTP